MVYFVLVWYDYRYFELEEFLIERYEDKIKVIF